MVKADASIMRSGARKAAVRRTAPVDEGRRLRPRRARLQHRRRGQVTKEIAPHVPGRFVDFIDGVHVPPQTSSNLVKRYGCVVAVPSRAHLHKRHGPLCCGHGAPPTAAEQGDTPPVG